MQSESTRSKNENSIIPSLGMVTVPGIKICQNIWNWWWRFSLNLKFSLLYTHTLTHALTHTLTHIYTHTHTLTDTRTDSLTHTSTHTLIDIKPYLSHFLLLFLWQKIWKCIMSMPEIDSTVFLTFKYILLGFRVPRLCQAFTVCVITKRKLTKYL